MEGWCSVEELVRWGFGHAPVVMANEAHSGLARCVRTREIGLRMIRAAHEAGVRRLAMEALRWPAVGVPGPIRAMPEAGRGYLAQPDMRRLRSALELGWSLWAYEAVPEAAPDTDPAMEFTNWRERGRPPTWQPPRAAAGLVRQWPRRQREGQGLGSHGLALPRYVRHRGVRHRPGRDGRLPRSGPAVGSAAACRAAETLAVHGATAGILSGQTRSPLRTWGYDAVVISTENTLT